MVLFQNRQHPLAITAYTRLLLVPLEPSRLVGNFVLQVGFKLGNGQLIIALAVGLATVPPGSNF